MQAVRVTTTTGSHIREAHERQSHSTNIVVLQMSFELCTEALFWSLWAVRFSIMYVVVRKILIVKNVIEHLIVVFCGFGSLATAGRKGKIYFADTAHPPHWSCLWPLRPVSPLIFLFLSSDRLASPSALIGGRTLGLTSPARSSTAKSPMRGVLWEGSSTHDARLDVRYRTTWKNRIRGRAELSQWT